MKTTTAISAVALSAAALTLGLAGTANAQQYGIDDPSDTAHGSDVLALQVRNGQENVIVKTFHDNLRKAPKTGSGGVVYIDTDSTDKGPEYAFVAGYTVGTDYQLIKTEGFGHKKWGKPVKHGDYEMKVNYRKDTVRTTMSHAALGDPSQVRVAVRVSGARSDGSTDGLIDWVGQPRSFTPWLAQG
jgi:hypothetical protein